MARGFKGEYNHTVDTKGRLIIPAKFREKLGETFVVTKGLDGCLYVYSDEEWEKIEDKFSELPLTDEDARQFTRFFFSGAADCEVDKQGRVLLPAVLREHAGIEKEAVLAGVLNRVEIWSKERWLKTKDYSDVNQIAKHMSEIGLRF